MKKQSVKKLQLRKKAISKFTITKVKGGSFHSNQQEGTHEHCCHPL